MSDNIPLKDANGATKTIARKEYSSVHYDQFAGMSNARIAAAASTNATSVKAAPGSIAGIYVFNNNAAIRFLKLYNKASAPTVGTDVPVMTIPIGPGAARSIDPPGGIEFTIGIAFATTTGIADNNSGAVGADDLHGIITYK